MVEVHLGDDGVDPAVHQIVADAVVRPRVVRPRRVALFGARSPPHVFQLALARTTIAEQWRKEEGTGGQEGPRGGVREANLLSLNDLGEDVLSEVQIGNFTGHEALQRTSSARGAGRSTWQGSVALLGNGMALCTRAARGAERTTGQGRGELAAHPPRAARATTLRRS